MSLVSLIAVVEGKSAESVTHAYEMIQSLIDKVVMLKFHFYFSVVIFLNYGMIDRK